MRTTFLITAVMAALVLSASPGAAQLVSVSPTGSANGDIAVSGTGQAHGSIIGVSGAERAHGGYLGASGTDNATATYVAVAGTDDPTDPKDNGKTYARSDYLSVTGTSNSFAGHCSRFPNANSVPVEVVFCIGLAVSVAGPSRAEEMKSCRSGMAVCVQVPVGIAVSGTGDAFGNGYGASGTGHASHYSACYDTLQAVVGRAVCDLV